jgi:hypothetical protein
MRRQWSVLGLVLCLALAKPASAQDGLLGRIRELFSFGSCGAPLCLDNSINATNGHGNHFVPDIIASNGAIIGFLGDAIAANSSNIPLSSTSSGATYKFEGGLPVRTSRSLGPLFGERAQTLGKGRFVIGANMTGLNFTSIRGVPLDELVLNFTHDDVAPTGLGEPIRENDLLQVRLDLNVNLLVSTFFATWGVSDAVDIGVAVPVVHAGLTGRSTGTLVPFGIPTSHFFAGDSAHPVLTASASTFGFATGLGDVALRLKGRLYDRQEYGVAFLLDGRLPTGSEENLSGAGHAAVRGLMLASARFADFAPHVNVGYAYRGGSGRNDALLATGGFDQRMADWATLAIDVFSEWQVGSTGLKLPPPVQYQFPVARTVVPTNIPNMRDDRVNGSFGVKFRTPGGPILVANAIVPLRRGGLESRLIWTLGIDGNF